MEGAASPVLVLVVEWDGDHLGLGRCSDSTSVDDAATASTTTAATHPRKIRIFRHDLPSSPSSDGQCRKISGQDLKTVLWNKMIRPEQELYGSNNGSSEGGHALALETLRVQVYDNRECRYVTIDAGETDVIQTFGSSRLRVLCSLLPCNTTNNRSSTSASTLHSDNGNSRCSSRKTQTSNSSLGRRPLLQIQGRFYPFDANQGVILTSTQSTISLRERPNSPNTGTGVTVWDGALLLLQYLDLCVPEAVRQKHVLELGAGCGLVGMAASLLGAQSVLLTDLPYVLPLLQSNIDRNTSARNDNGQTRRRTMECTECDWTQPLSQRVMEYPANVILIADCVWLEELVQPLMITLGRLLQAYKTRRQRLQPEEKKEQDGSGDSVHVLISYQRRGKSTHEAFWKGLLEIFGVSSSQSSKMEVVDLAALGLVAPESLQIISCRYEVRPG